MKVAISVPEDLIEDAKRAVEAGLVPSVSAYVAAALTNYRHRQTLRELLDDIQAEIGQPTPQERVWAKQELGLTR